MNKEIVLIRVRDGKEVFRLTGIEVFPGLYIRSGNFLWRVERVIFDVKLDGYEVDVLEFVDS